MAIFHGRKTSSEPSSYTKLISKSRPLLMILIDPDNTLSCSAAIELMEYSINPKNSNNTEKKVGVHLKFRTSDEPIGAFLRKVRHHENSEVETTIVFMEPPSTLFRDKFLFTVFKSCQIIETKSYGNEYSWTVRAHIETTRAANSDKTAPGQEVCGRS